MKNKFLKKIFVLLAVLSSCFLFASFSPSLDGRAVVVNEGEMPSGLFAKTVGYLPGDTIIVSNVDGTASVEILVIGSLDASEGVAIMLSPEAASAIGIDKNENNIVKITKRSDKDERCTGMAIIAKGSEIEEKSDVQDNMIEETTDEVEAENQSENSDLENVEKTEEILPTEEDTFTEEEIEEKNQPEIGEDEILPVEEEKFVEEEVLAETEENVSEELESEEVFVDELSDLENVEKTEEILLPEEETFTEEKIEEENQPEIVEDEILPVEEEKFVEEEVLAETEENVSEEVFVDELSDLENVEKTEEILLPEEETFTEEKIEEENQSDSDEYEAIVLIPVEPEKSIILSDGKENNEEVMVENLETKTENSEITISESEKSIETKSVIEKYKVESLDKLEKGSYYIQIVVLKEESNIQKIIDKYGNNYPITIVPLKSKNAYQILIGPISMDEYGTVLNRFKSYGYKDAFLRKIK